MKLIKYWEIINLHQIILQSSATGTLQLKQFRNGDQMKTTCPKWIWQIQALSLSFFFYSYIKLCHKLHVNCAMAVFSFFFCIVSILFLPCREMNTSLSNKGAIFVLHHEIRLKKIAQMVQNNITPDYLRSLYKSTPQTIQAVVDAEGGHTEY